MSEVIKLLRTHAKLWVSATVCLTLCQALASVFLPRGYVLTTVSDVLCALMMLAPLAAFASNAIPAEGRMRAFWILQAFGWLMWLADQGVWIAYDIVLRKPLPEATAADALLFLAGVPMLAGLLLRPHLQPSERSARLGMMDFSLLMVWWIYFYVYLVFSWQYISVNLPLYNRNYDYLYDVELAVLVIVLLAVLKYTRGAWRRFYAYYLGAVVFNSAAFILQNRAIEQGTYYNGSWYDTPYLASFAIFMVVAMKGQGLKPRPETEAEEKRGSWMARLAMLAVLSLPVIAVSAVLDHHSPFDVVRFRVIATVVTMFVMAALVFMKQHRLHEQLKQSNEVLQDASMTDPLTGVRNRRFFTATIEGDVAKTLRAYADGHEPTTRDLVFYLVDADDFKEVNDRYGHDAGDRVLVEMSRRISSAIRNSDVLVRWGGEEFLIVSRYTDRREAEILALRVMEAVGERPYNVRMDGESIRRTCSVGWAAFPWLEQRVDEIGHEEVLNLADRGLQQAKSTGKNRAVGMIASREGTTQVVSGLVDISRMPVSALAVAGPKA